MQLYILQCMAAGILIMGPGEYWSEWNAPARYYIHSLCAPAGYHTVYVCVRRTTSSNAGHVHKYVSMQASDPSCIHACMELGFPAGRPTTYTLARLARCEASCL